jgi:hypothetical protein
VRPDDAENNSRSVWRPHAHAGTNDTNVPEGGRGCLAGTSPVGTGACADPGAEVRATHPPIASAAVAQSTETTHRLVLRGRDICSDYARTGAPSHGHPRGVCCKGSVAEAVDNLILDLLEWLDPQPRPYAEVLEAWRTSCPRLPVWEDANDRGYIARGHVRGGRALVSVSAAGKAHLRTHRSVSAV